MNFKQSLVVSEILPAFFMFGLLAFSFWNFFNLTELLSSQLAPLVLQAGSLFISAWIVGNFFEALRNGILEQYLNKFKSLEINWASLYKVSNKEKRDFFEEQYYEFYSLDVNFIIASLSFIILSLALHCGYQIPFSVNDAQAFAVAAVFSFVFYIDALSLRSEMSDICRDGF